MVLFSHEVTGENKVRYTAAAESGDKLGTCEFSYLGYKMNITAIDCADDIIIEGLLRAAMNYGANRMVYICTVTKNMLCPALTRLGYSDDKLTVEIPEALSSSHCKCE